MTIQSSSFFTHRFANGIRLIHQHADSAVSHCGVVIKAGTRNEAEQEHGIAHLLEHMAFKGTKNRKAYHIIARVEDVGGEIDAYTTKEITCYYSSFLNRHFKRTLELLSDITFNATYPQKELDKEKQVVLEEIQMYKDSPSELIFDDFEEHIFANQSIGRNILGTPKSVKKLSRSHIESFRNRMYNTDQIVICSVGNANRKDLLKWVEQFFGQQPQNIRTIQPIPKPISTEFTKTIHKKTNQAHVITGIEAFDHAHPQRVVLRLIANLLAGPAMNTRLNRALRENKGLVYNVESFYGAYSDTGLTGFYFGTDKSKIDHSLAAITKELLKIKNERIGTLQLSRAQNQLMGQIAIASESNANLMLSFGKKMLFFDSAKTIAEAIAEIEKITPSDIMEVSNKIYDTNHFSTLIYI